MRSSGRNVAVQVAFAAAVLLAAPQLLAQGVTANDAEVGAAVAFVFREFKLVVEPGGVVGLAALLAGRIEARGKTIVIVLSGGNVDADLYARLVA